MRQTLPTHLDGFPEVVCGIPSVRASLVTDDLMGVTCPNCLAVVDEEIEKYHALVVERDPEML